MKTRRLPNYQHEDKYNLYTIHGLFAPTNQNIALIIELIFKQYIYQPFDYSTSQFSSE